MSRGCDRCAILEDRLADKEASQDKIEGHLATAMERVNALAPVWIDERPNGWGEQWWLSIAPEKRDGRTASFIVRVAMYGYVCIYEGEQFDRDSPLLEGSKWSPFLPIADPFAVGAGEG